MKIGNVQIDNNLFLAPMAGVTDIGFRKVCHECGAGLTYTEMVSVKGFYYRSQRTMEMLKTFDGERPVAVQLFGHDPEMFAKVVGSGVLDKFDIIDINMGCPAPKIVKNGDGSALLKDMTRARTIIEATVKATTKPVTVKFRIGYDEGENVAVEFARMCEQAGAKAICVHGRTRSQFYSGKANLEVIRQVKQSVTIPVIGNGDVVDKASYKAMLDTGVDAVMIGRGALGHPEIFAQLIGKQVNISHMDIITEHIDTLLLYDRMSQEFKKHLLWYVGGYPGCNEIKVQLMQAEKSQYIPILRDFFDSQSTNVKNCN